MTVPLTIVLLTLAVVVVLLAAWTEFEREFRRYVDEAALRRERG